MKLDLSSLEQALGSLQQSLETVGDTAWFDAQPAPVRNTLIAGVIQNFEFVYELGIRMLRRRLELDAATPTEVDFDSFRDLMRTAGERGLIGDVEAWFGYRKMRNITSHTYDQNKARILYQGTLRFVGDAEALLRQLTARND